MSAESEYLSPVLESLVQEFEYKPGWDSFIMYDKSSDGSGGWTFFIVSNTENSLRPGKRIEVHHPFLIPPASYDEANWIAWIRDRCADVENHELGEFFKIRGIRVFAPHHSKGQNPYVVWHVSDYATAAKKQGDD